LIQAAREHHPDAIGLSGLLVKSAQQMVVTASDLHDAGIRLPLLVGGAALSDRFTRTKIAPAYDNTVVYAKDAMTGLDIMNRLMTPDARAQLEADLAAKDFPELRPRVEVVSGPATNSRSSRVSTDIPIPGLPDLDRHIVELTDLDEVWSYINPQMLYGRHLGIKGRFEQLLQAGDRKAVELEKRIEEVKEECRNGAMRVRAVWQFFEAESDDNSIRIYSGPEALEPIQRFVFPRQAKPDGMALSDLVLPPDRDSVGQVKRRDHIAMFVTTAGVGIRKIAEEAKDRGEYLRSYGLQALAIETAEAAAELIHSGLRAGWGFPDSADLTRQALFQARYRGKRYSFGYPACPELESQAGLFRLMRPEEIGVELTEGFMMEPEASVSALVFH
ncbi:MAG: vitamin B12 dependent-methionine synthase activation domain-containing protein, partial [Blastocatellia bacterium]